MSETTKKSEHGEGKLTAGVLRRLLGDVPATAEVRISQADPDDYRNRGKDSWHFEARWSR